MKDPLRIAPTAPPPHSQSPSPTAPPSFVSSNSSMSPMNSTLMPPDEAPYISAQASGTSMPPDIASGITLQAIGLTLVGGLFISLMTVIAFGVAVMVRHTNVAPRCTTRHPNTIWRSRRDMYGGKSSKKKEPKTDSSSRRRSNAADNITHNNTSRRGNKTLAAIATDLNDSFADGKKERKEDEFVHNLGVDPPTAGKQTMGKYSDRSDGSNSNGGSDNMHAFAGMGELSSVDEGVPMNGNFPSTQGLASLDGDVSKLNDDQDNDELYAHPQDRGNPFLGWIPWTLHLSYDRMLRGIPGTGTRERGMGGKLLDVNLDAIILFRFHALCLRVTAVACFICIGFILPLNMTACEDSSCNAHLTNYGRTTIANIHTSVDSDETSTDVDRQNINVFSTIFWTGKDKTLSDLLRLYTISICTWYIAYFTLKNIKRDWNENLVLRRVYYLEADHYGNRQSELDKTVNQPQAAGKVDSESQPPWIPHPEHRETVPNVELYSVLVGGLPSIPNEVVNTKDMNSQDMQTALGFSKKKEIAIDWQLAVATTFFDHCVPNQPGFSSSVVAVTILPGAPELAKAWRKWYSAAAALRRLRFIRQLINEKRYYAIDDVDEEIGDTSSTFKHHNTRESIESDEYFLEDTQPPQSTKSKVTFLDEHESPTQRSRDVETRAMESQLGFGTVDNSSDVDYRIFQSLNYGPEQQAVYSRSMSQAAATCCPNGYCCDGRVKRQPIDRLEQMEIETVDRLKNAQMALQCAQEQAAMSIVDGGDKTAKKPSKEGNSVATECMLQRNNSVGDGSSPKHPSSSENTFWESTNGSAIRNAPPRTHDYLSNDFSEQHSDRNFVKNLPSVTGSASQKLDAEAQRFHGTALPSTAEGRVGRMATQEDQGVGLDMIATPQFSRSVQNLSIGTLPTKSNFCKSPLNIKSPVHPDTRSTVLRMSSEGKFLFNNAPIDEDEESMPLAEPSLRRRANTAQSAVSEGDVSKSSNQWNQVNRILSTSDAEDHHESSSSRNKREIKTGVWQKPSVKSFMAAVKSDILSSFRAVGRWTMRKTDPLTSKLAKDSTYAVVTFSSRQAAVAARHCLADGRGVQRWLSVETVPVSPLADAAPCDIITCRGCCRPVTLNLNHNQLMIRRYIALASLAFIYVFYTIPITAAQSLVAPQSLKEMLPGLDEWLSQTEYLSAEIMSGLVSALLYTLFFAVCPFLFTAISNSGSRATSIQEAEKYALQYYWYFMLVTAFVFTGLADAAMNIWNHSFSNVEQSIEDLIESIASQTPLTTAATWLNWIIVRTTMTLPLHYLLGVNSFAFGCIGWKCCARCVIGGGPGGPIPYRIYVDGGVVFLCVVALAPQSPLVAPVALLYYLFCIPLWRRNCIFMYRPKFDSGGEHWPFLSDMLITSLFMGQFLLTLQMVLKDAFGPAFFAALPAGPTFLYRQYLITRFRRAYNDAGLLQTSLLDGWDNTIPTSVEKREEFRQFLVDAHKAAYIPVCIAGGATNILTAEPAVVIPSENDDMLGYVDLVADAPLPPYFGDQAHTLPSDNGTLSDSDGVSTPTSSNQNGAYMRRAMSFSSRTPRSKTSQFQ